MISLPLQQSPWVLGFPLKRAEARGQTPADCSKMLQGLTHMPVLDLDFGLSCHLCPVGFLAIHFPPVPRSASKTHPLSGFKLTLPFLIEGCLPSFTSQGTHLTRTPKLFPPCCFPTFTGGALLDGQELWGFCLVCLAFWGGVGVSPPFLET